MHYKYLYLIPILILTGCQATGVKPMKNSQLNGKTRTLVSNSEAKTNKIIEKELVIVVPKTTNYFEIKPTKELLESKNPIKLEIVSQPSSNTVYLKVDSNQKNEVIGNNFLVLWYGSLGFAAIFYLLCKFRVKKKKNTDTVPSI